MQWRSQDLPGGGGGKARAAKRLSVEEGGERGVHLTVGRIFENFVRKSADVLMFLSTHSSVKLSLFIWFHYYSNSLIR